MKRFTLGAALVALGVGLLAAPGSSVASDKRQACDKIVYHSGTIVTAQIDHIYATHVGCGLARRLARETNRHAHQVSARDYRYHWHRFAVFGHITSRYTTGAGVKIRFRAHRAHGRQKVRFRILVVD